MNYIKIINKFWEEAPFIDGFKSSHVALFFPVLHLINRNNWRKTKIDLGYILVLSGLSKPTYIETRKWLVLNNFIEVIEGKNAYQMAEFSIKVEDSIEVNIEDKIFTSTLSSTDTSTLSSTDTSTLPISNKQVNSKQINSTVVPTAESEPKKTKVFVPPTLEEVEKFFIEKTGVSGRASKEFAVKFHSHYELNNWIYGRAKTKMQKWKLAFAQWNLQEYIDKYPQQTEVKNEQKRSWSATVSDHS